MQDQLELFPKPPKTEKIIAQAKEAIKKILKLHRQPSAGNSSVNWSTNTNPHVR